MVEAFPNVTALDLTQVQEVIEKMIARVTLAIRFMALFSLAAGVVVLLGAVAASRDQRIREGVLLKTLGATRAQVLRVILAEYLSLGALASVSALAPLAAGGMGAAALPVRVALPAAARAPGRAVRRRGRPHRGRRALERARGLRAVAARGPARGLSVGLRILVPGPQGASEP